MSLRLVTPPATLPVSVAEAKLHWRVEHDADDALIATLIRASAAACEQELNRALMAQTWDLIIDAFPEAEIRLPKPRALEVLHVQYVAVDGVTRTLGADAWTLDPDLIPGYLLPALGTGWPATRDQANAVRVRFRTGYGTEASSLPDSLRVWILMHAGTAYRNRESVVVGASVAEVPGRYLAGLLDSERLFW
jgi:uncharacterized phiE125 gp8 family phage protein